MYMANTYLKCGEDGRWRQSCSGLLHCCSHHLFLTEGGVGGDDEQMLGE